MSFYSQEDIETLQNLAHKYGYGYTHAMLAALEKEDD